MAQKKVCRLTMEEETIDKITELPDNILGHILNRYLFSFPIEVAFQMCLLSKRWNTNLSMLPSVNLSKIFTKDYSPPKYELLNTFDKYLRMREKMTKQVDIERFTIKVHDTDSQFAMYMNTWVNILTRCNIKEIFFSNSNIGEYSFPQDIFFAKSLTSLHLKGCKLECKCFSDIKLVSLKRLVLVNVDISNELIQQLIKSCVVMEDLCLSLCKSLTTLKVAGLHGLNKLTLDYNYKLKTLEIDEPSLLSFTYCGPYGVGIKFANCTGLKKLHLGDSDITDEWLGEQLLLLEHLEDLEIKSCHGIRFLSIRNCHLKRLHLGLSFKRLEVNIDAPNLQSFSLKCFYNELISLSLSAPPTLEVNLDIRSRVFGPGLYINLLNILGFFDHSRLNLKTNLPDWIIPQEWRKCFFGTKSVARFRKSWVDPEARMVDVLRSIYPGVKSSCSQNVKILTEEGIEVSVDEE